MDISNYLSSLISSGKTKNEIASLLDEELNKALTKKHDYADDALLALNNYYINYGKDYEEDTLYDIYPTTESFIDFLDSLAQARFEIAEEKPCTCDKASVSPLTTIAKLIDEYYTKRFPDSYTSGDFFNIYPDEESFTKYLDNIYQSFLILQEFGDKNGIQFLSKFFKI